MQNTNEDRSLTGQLDDFHDGGIMLINDDQLRRFYDWLQAKGDDPSIALALKWIVEFEVYAQEDEDAFRDVKAFAKLRAAHDPDAAVALRVITWVEETQEPDPMLKRLKGWLLAKGNDPTAVLMRWWLAEFEEAQEDRPETAPTQH